MKESISKKKLRQFGFLIGFGFPILIGWIIPAVGGHVFRTWTLWIAFPSLMIGILKPRLLFYPYKGWMLLGLALGWINSRIILGLVFFLVLQPIALIMKFLGYDPLKIKKSNERSYRENKKDHKVNLTRIF
tara:strand:+ start:372 stop:764 length:393 start_codon:yes stop_codon:yes gene_type:complete